VYPSLID